jgi:hypothetical protein
MIGADTIIAELVLQVAKLTSEISQLRAEVSGSPNFVEGWATPRDAAIALRNEGVKSVKHLHRLRLDDVFTDVRDVRNTSQGDRPTWAYNIPNCRKALRKYFKDISTPNGPG